MFVSLDANTEFIPSPPDSCEAVNADEDQVYHFHDVASSGGFDTAQATSNNAQMGSYYLGSLFGTAGPSLTTVLDESNWWDCGQL